MSSLFNSIVGIDGALRALGSALNTAFADIWCVAIFVLVDVATPYAIQALNNVGLYQGIGATVFTNFILILKFTLCDQWKMGMKSMGLVIP